MTTIQIDEKTKEGSKLIAFLKTLDYVSFEPWVPNGQLKNAMYEAEKRYTVKCDDLSDMKKSLDS